MFDQFTNPHGWHRGWSDDDEWEGERRVVIHDKPKADPKPLDPEIVKAVTHFGLYTGADSLAAITKPRAYLFTKKGVKLVSRGVLGTFVADAKEIPLVEDLENGLTLAIPRLPWDLLSQTVAFFRHVNEKRGSEAIVQFFWNLETKSYLAYCPPQRVSGGGVHHEGNFDKDNSGKWAHVLDIHSHNTMSAFWSGTDDHDEARFENRLFGVIGRVKDKTPEMKWRARVGGQFVDLPTRDVVEAPDIEATCMVSTADLIDSKDRSFSRRFEIDPFEGATFPPEWEKAIVEEPVTRVGFPQGDGDRRRVVVGEVDLIKTPVYVIDTLTNKVYMEDSITKEFFPSVFTSAQEIRIKWPSATIMWSKVDMSRVRGVKALSIGGHHGAVRD